jgi:hypothetical protein
LIIGVALLRTAPHVGTSVSSNNSTPTTLNTPTSAPQSTSTTVNGLRPRNQVHVLVANGAGVANLGARIRTQLNGAGYNTDKPAIDAPTSNNPTTTVYYTPGFQPDAEDMATNVLDLAATAVQQLSPASPPVPATQLVGIDILVVAGQDIAAPQTTSPPGATVAPGTTATTTASGPTTTIHRTTTTTHPPTTHAPTTKAPTPTSPPTTAAAGHPTTTVNLR